MAADAETASDTVALNDAPQAARDFFNKGLAALERGNLDYAIEMFQTSLGFDRRLLDVRKFLRAAQVRQFKQSGRGGMAHLLSTLTGLPQMVTVWLMTRRQPAKAMETAELLLRKDPLNLKFISLFAHAAEAAGMVNHAIQTLSIAKDYYSENVSLIVWLGEAYMQNGQIKEARNCYESAARIRPNDGEVKKALKNAMAMESITKDRWDKAQDFKEVLKDSEESIMLEREAKAVRSTGDTTSLIAQELEKIQREPDNVNYYRRLADLYATNLRFDDAMETLKQAQERRGGGDPELDASISGIRMKQYDHEAEELRKAGDEAAAKSLEEKKAAYYFANVQERARKYPNDLTVRYELGTELFKRKLYNDAILQFQLSQRNPHQRLSSMFHLGLCLKAKSQFDMAQEQLKKALLELPSMNKMKKDICYELGLIEEQLQHRDKAIEYFKQIYQVDIGYKDVAQKVEQVYRQ